MEEGKFGKAVWGMGRAVGNMPFFFRKPIQ